MGRGIKQYEMMRGYEIIAKGTIKELAEIQGVKPGTIRFYTSPTYQARGTGDRGRLIVIPVED